MKYKYLSPLIILFTLWACLSCEQQKSTPVHLVNSYIETVQDYSSISYDIDYQIKPYQFLEDTFKYSAKIDLIRLPQDDILGGYVWISSDSIDRYYDTKAFYVINHNSKSITKYPTDKSSSITGAFIGEARRIYFLDSGLLLKGVSDTNNTITLTEGTNNKAPFWKLNLVFPDEGSATNIWKSVWINKTDYSVSKINFSMDMDGENQCNAWNIKERTYNQVTIEDLENRLNTYKKTYSLHPYKPISYDDFKPLPNGTVLPDITGYHYSDSSVFNSRAYKGKLILYDFWYMDCKPCVNAIPELNILYKKYGDKGLHIVGFNPYNNNENSRRRLPKFLNRNPVNYDFVFIDHKDIKDFKVIGFPTLYLIDKSGKVIFNQAGHMDDFANHMDSIIRTNL